MAAPSNLTPSTVSGASLDPNSKGGTTQAGGALPADVAQGQRDAAGQGLEAKDPVTAAAASPFVAGEAPGAKEKPKGKEGEGQAEDPYAKNEAVLFLRQWDAQTKLANAQTMQDRNKALGVLNRAKRLANIGYQWLVNQAKQAAAAGVEMAMRVGAERAAQMGQGQNPFMAANLAGRLVAQANDNVNTFQAQIASRASQFGLQIASQQAQIYQNTKRQTMDAAQAVGIAGLIARGQADAEALAQFKKTQADRERQALPNRQLGWADYGPAVKSTPAAALDPAHPKNKVPVPPPGQFAPETPAAPPPAAPIHGPPDAPWLTDPDAPADAPTDEPGVESAAEAAAHEKEKDEEAFDTATDIIKKAKAKQEEAFEEATKVILKKKRQAVFDDPLVKVKMDRLPQASRDAITEAIRKNPKMTPAELRALIDEYVAIERETEQAYEPRERDRS